jgi:TonB family protein
MIRPSAKYASPFVLLICSFTQLGSNSFALSLPIPSAELLYFMASQHRIPEASESCSPEEARWWQNVREAGHQFASAAQLKHQAMIEARRRRRIREDRNDGFSQDEREGYDAQIIKAREKYMRLLREGVEKTYRVPIRDRKIPLVLYGGRPWYTREARAGKVTGEVKLNSEFRADGTIGEVKILKGLGYGLDEMAIEAVRQMVFLPAVGSGRLINISKPIVVTFTLN